MEQGVAQSCARVHSALFLGQASAHPDNPGCPACQPRVTRSCWRAPRYACLTLMRGSSRLLTSSTRAATRSPAAPFTAGTCAAWQMHTNVCW